MAAVSTTEPAEIKHPLSRWEKVKAGVKGFVKSALHYIPHGIIMVPIALGGMMMLGNATGWSWLPHYVSGAQFMGKAAIGLLLGSLLSGGVGAYQEIKNETQKREAEIAAQEAILQRHRSRVPERYVETEPVETPGGLPMAAKVLSHTIVH